MNSDSDRVLRAISVAARAHQGQHRKDGLTPYVAHPLRVMTILVTRFNVRDPELLATAVLHDTLEDTTLDRDDLSEQFGECIAQWVADLSKDKRLPEANREAVYLETLSQAPLEVKLCKLADTLDNLLDVAALSAPSREKAIGKAVDVLVALEPRLPAEWNHVACQVRDQIRQLQASSV